MNKSQNYINHIVFVLDESTSMLHLKKEVVKVFDSQIKHLANISKQLDQETRVSVYTFSYQNNIKCIIYDKDVMRHPTVEYSPNGNTALLDASMLAINDLKETPQKYGDHSFLVYVITDGENNDSKTTPLQLENTIKNLPENWTVGIMVPNQSGVFSAKKCGFPANNIQVWSCESGGIEQVGEKIKKATDNFMAARAKGLRGTKNLFDLDVSNLTTATVESTLDKLNASDYLLVSISKDSVIKPTVESWTKQPYVAGSAYYQLTKPETVQGYKQICIQNKKNGKVYSGTNARSILKLPDSEVKVSPLTHGEFDIFVQSTAPNRKLIGGTKLLILK